MVFGVRLMSSWSRLGKLYHQGAVADKIRLIDNTKTVRCGVIGRGLVGALTVDHMEARKSWAREYLEAELNSVNENKLIKYGDEFSKTDLGYTVPSSFLQNNKVEFLKVNDTSGKDGCHFYIRLNQKNLNPKQDIWPVVELEDVKYNGSFLLANQIDVVKSVQATLDMGNSKISVSDYLKAQEESNFDHVRHKLEAKLKNRNTIIQDLKNAVVRYIQKTDPDISSIGKESTKLDKAYLAIDEWAEDAHKQLQSQIIPSFVHFAKTQLSLWKLYLHSESKLKLRFMECCMIPLYNIQVIEGKSEVLETNIRNEFDQTGVHEPIAPLVPVNDIQKIGNIQKDINKAIYHQFFTLQLPMILVALLGVVSEQFSGFYMGSVAALGIVLGFSRTMTKWKQILNVYTNRITRIIKDRVEMRRSDLKRRAKKYHDQKNATLIKKEEVLKSILHQQ